MLAIAINTFLSPFFLASRMDAISSLRVWEELETYVQVAEGCQDGGPAAKQRQGDLAALARLAWRQIPEAERPPGWHSLPHELLTRIANLTHHSAGAMMLACQPWSASLGFSAARLELARNVCILPHSRMEVNLFGESLLTTCGHTVLDLEGKEQLTGYRQLLLSPNGLILTFRSALSKTIEWRVCRSPDVQMSCAVPTVVNRVQIADRLERIMSNKMGVCALEAGARLWISSFDDAKGALRFVEVPRLPGTDYDDYHERWATNKRFVTFCGSDEEFCVINWSDKAVAVLRVDDPAAPPRLIDVDPAWLSRFRFRPIVSPDGLTLVGAGRAVSIRGPAAETLWEYPLFNPDGNPDSGFLAFFADGKTLLYQAHDDLLHLRQASSGRTTHTLRITRNGLPFSTPFTMLSLDNTAVRFESDKRLYTLPLAMFQRVSPGGTPSKSVQFAF